MSARQKTWAKQWRDRLTRILGARCMACGQTDGLTFDCRTPVSDGHARLDSSARMSRYRAQWRKGNLQLLCAPCNALKSHTPLAVWAEAVRYMRESVALARLARSQDQGHTLTPRECRDCIAAYLSRWRTMHRRDHNI